MRKKWKSYLGGHTVLSQPPGLYMRRLETEAVQAQKRAEVQQRVADRLQRKEAKEAAKRKRVLASWRTRPVPKHIGLAEVAISNTKKKRPQRDR